MLNINLYLSTLLVAMSHRLMGLLHLISSTAMSRIELAWGAQPETKLHLDTLLFTFRHPLVLIPAMTCNDTLLLSRGLRLIWRIILAIAKALGKNRC
jgi:hypothetical protein